MQSNQNSVMTLYLTGLDHAVVHRQIRHVRVRRVLSVCWSLMRVMGLTCRQSCD